MNGEDQSQSQESDWHKVNSHKTSSLEQLATILDRIAEGITVQDSQGQLVYANDIAAQWLGFTNREALLSTPIAQVTAKFKIFDEQGTPFPIERLPGRRAIKDGQEFSETIRFRITETGEERWSIVRASPVRGSTGQVEFAVNIFQNITNFKKSEEDLRFLAEVGEMLANSLDYEAVLTNVANMAVRSIADWCVIHVIEGEEIIKQLAVAHKDPAKLAITRFLEEKYPPNAGANGGIFQVLRTGKPQFFPEISDAEMKALARDDDHYTIMRSLGLRSAIILPFIARGHILGGITLVWSESRNRYGEREIMLGKELARRAAIAIDNVRLYQEANRINSELETQVEKRTAQLERIVSRLQSEIAERQTAEKNLQKNEALFSDLFEMSPDAIFLVNSKGKIVRANAQAVSMFGYDQADLLKKSIDQLLPERFRAIHARHRRKYLKTAQRRAMGADLELYGKRKSGQEFPVDVMLSPIEIDDEWLVISVVRDITEQKNTQIELAEVQHHLMDTLEAERLMLAQELHDGTIQELFSITYELAEIENDLAQDEHSQAKEKLHTTSQSAQRIIQSLRNLSRELRPPALAPFGLEQAIISHLEHFQELHPEIAVHSDLTPDGDVLDERPRLVLFRIYQNAVSNVARHARAGHLWVRLDLDNQQVTLEIRDDGIGFVLPRRWVEMARKGHLGLVSIRERTEAIGGRLKIETRPRKGTRIRVTVPIH